MSDESAALGLGFERLLTTLDQDGERAASAYATVRRKLAKFFEWRGCRDAEFCADATLERVARRLAEGAVITTPNPYAFIHGVAINVLREYLREPERRFTSLEDAPEVSERATVDPLEAQQSRSADDRRHDCLDRCVRQLPVEQRHALLRYHEGQQRARIDRRKALADSLGISVATLRLRMFRIRETLERCIVTCLGVTAGVK